MNAPSRRALLGASLAGGAAAVLAACEAGDGAAPAPSTASSPATATPSAAPSPTVDTATFDPADWESVRAQFNLDPSLGQFAAFVFSPHTKPLDAAIAGYRDGLGFDTEGALNSTLNREAAVRQAAAAYAGGRPGQYALTDSTTMGIATMYGGLALEPRDEVLTTVHDFYSTTESLALLRRRTGATVRHVSLYDDPARATVDELVDRLVAGVSSRTRVVAVTWVHSSTGVRLPIREIADALASSSGVPRDQITFCVDGVHGFNAVDVDLPDLGADFLATGTHKWLFGPRGTGILWGRDFGRLTQLIPSFSGNRSGEERLTAGGYHAFEHRWAVKDAFDLAARITRPAIVQRTVDQASRLKTGLAGIDGLTVVTPQDPQVSAGIVCVDVPGTMPANLVQSLRPLGVVASATPYAVSYLRLGPSIATTPEQVDTAVDALSQLA